MTQSVVGRMVWYRDTVGVEPTAAIITCVLNDNTVNLYLFEPYGTVHPRLNVRFVRDGDEMPAPMEPYCVLPNV